MTPDKQQQEQLERDHQDYLDERPGRLQEPYNYYPDSIIPEDVEEVDTRLFGWILLGVITVVALAGIILWVMTKHTLKN